MPLRNGEYIISDSSVDLDDVKRTGAYLVSGSLVNGSAYYGYLLVFNHNDGDVRAKQIIFSNWTPEIMQRFCNSSGIWQDWTVIVSA